MQVSLAPTRRLDRFVRAVRITTESDPTCAYVRLPDGEVDLGLASDGRLVVVGTRTGPLRARIPRAEGAVIVRFRAGGAYPFFGVPISELTDRVVPLDALWGPDASRLETTLRELADPVRRVRALESVLLARLAGPQLYEPPATRAVQKALRLLEREDAPRGLPELARSVGLSERQFRRSFHQVVGVAPKTAARILRFRRALDRARATREGWGTIADELGYYDQAHLASDFRAFAGHPPSDWARGTTPPDDPSPG